MKELVFCFGWRAGASTTHAAWRSKIYNIIYRILYSNISSAFYELEFASQCFGPGFIELRTGSSFLFQNFLFFSRKAVLRGHFIFVGPDPNQQTRLNLGSNPDPSFGFVSALSKWAKSEFVFGMHSQREEQQLGQIRLKGKFRFLVFMCWGFFEPVLF